MDYKPTDNDFILAMGEAVRPGDVHHHFDTPDWMTPRAEAAELLGGPAAIPEQPGEPGPATAVLNPPAIPHQVVPTHDEQRTAAPPAGPASPAEARWKAKHKVRTLFGLLLVPFLAAAVAGGYYAYHIGSMEYLPVAAIPALIIVGIWGAMINTTPPVTTLKGSKIAVRHDGTVDEFDLANPDQAIETTRDASDPRWKAKFERLDGSQLVLTRKHVPPAEFPMLLQHYRRIAAELLEQRVRRYQA